MSRTNAYPGGRKFYPERREWPVVWAIFAALGAVVSALVWWYASLSWAGLSRLVAAKSPDLSQQSSTFLAVYLFLSAASFLLWTVPLACAIYGAFAATRWSLRVPALVSIGLMGLGVLLAPHTMEAFSTAHLSHVKPGSGASPEPILWVDLARWVLLVPLSIGTAIACRKIDSRSRKFLSSASHLAQRSDLVVKRAHAKNVASRFRIGAITSLCTALAMAAGSFLMYQSMTAAEKKFGGEEPAFYSLNIIPKLFGSWSFMFPYLVMGALATLLAAIAMFFGFRSARRQAAENA